MESLDSTIRRLHSDVMYDFLSNACSDIDRDSVISCISDVLSKHGFTISRCTLLSIDGEVVQSPEFARYVRVEARHPDTGNISHIFTFAIIRRRDKYDVLYLQSAVIVK